MKRTILVLALSCAIPIAAASDPPDTKDAETRAARAELDRAHEELRRASRRVAELSAKLGREHGGRGERTYAYRFFSGAQRAMVGVVLGGDADGVRLAAVTPGGPAEKAGLRAGDRIVAINGKDVPKAPATRPAGDPAMRAVLPVERDAQVEAARGLIGELNPGEKVRFVYERDGKRSEVTVAAEKRETWEWPLVAGAFAPNIDIAFGELEDFGELAHDIERDVRIMVERTQDNAHRARHDAERMTREADRIRRNVVVMRDGSFRELKLAGLNPELGRYFGTTDGVLVLDRGDESFVELKPGDVIVSVDGNAVEDSRDVMRAFMHKREGEVANVEIVRDKRRQVLVLEVPEGAPILVVPPVPPAPPAAPAAPRAPAPPALPAPRAVPAPQPPQPAQAPEPPEPPGRLARIIDGTEVI